MKYILIILLVLHLQSKSIIYYITIHSRKWQVDSRVVWALIQAESEGKYMAQSKKGAYGLMQIMLQTAKDYYIYMYFIQGKEWARHWLAVPDSILKIHTKVSSVNIRIGCWKLRQNLVLCRGNYIQALNMYINGVTGSQKSTSWKYLNKIMDKIIKFDKG
jgi:hypothetical protein